MVCRSAKASLRLPAAPLRSFRLNPKKGPTLDFEKDRSDSSLHPVEQLNNKCRFNSANLFKIENRSLYTVSHIPDLPLHGTIDFCKGVTKTLNLAYGTESTPERVDQVLTPPSLFTQVARGVALTEISQLTFLIELEGRVIMHKCMSIIVFSRCSLRFLRF